MFYIEDLCKKFVFFFLGYFCIRICYVEIKYILWPLYFLFVYASTVFIILSYIQEILCHFNSKFFFLDIQVKPG